MAFIAREEENYKHAEIYFQTALTTTGQTANTKIHMDALHGLSMVFEIRGDIFLAKQMFYNVSYY